MHANLFDYQKTGARFLAERDFAYNADDPGLGKSAQAVTCAILSGAKTVRVVAPATVRENWHREFNRFGGSDIAVQSLSYEGATKLHKAGELRATDYLIVDEAHYLQSREAQRTRAILGPKLDLKNSIAALSGKTSFLSGTPARANPSQLWPVLHAAFPESVKTKRGTPLDFWAFAKRYCHVKDNGFGLQIEGGRNLEDLRLRMAPYFIRRKADDVLKDLPEIRFGTVIVEPKTVAREVRAIEHEMSGEIEAALRDGDLERLSQSTAGLRRFIGLAKIKPVFDLAIEELIYTDKLVLFAWHVDVLDGLEKLFREQNIDVVRIDGGTPAGRRQQAVDRFQTNPDCRVFLGNILAAGVGNTLTAAHRMLIVESSYTPADNWQAALRIRRIGQKSDCLVRFVALAGSYDERITEIVEQKTRTLAQLGF